MHVTCHEGDACHNDETPPPAPSTPMRTGVTQTLMLAPPRAAGDGDAEQKGAHSSLVKTHTVRRLWKMPWWFLTELNTLSPRDLVITLRGISPREPKTRLHKGLHTDIHGSFSNNSQTWKHRDVLR